MKRETWTPAYIGVGSNLDDPRAQVLRGIESLSSLPKTRVVACSELYRTKPHGPQDQPDYVNAAVGLLTQLDPAALLSLLKSSETELGRGRPVVRWGPRVIDFDLLTFGDIRMDTDDLKLPHRGVAERGFVLRPLLDIAPDLQISGVGSVRSLAARVDMSGVEALNG